MLKPDIVYFGESVPKDRVPQAYSLVDEADALLVAGSSLTVFSGLCGSSGTRPPRASPSRSSTAAPPAATTLATVKVDGGCSELLALLADELAIGALTVSGARIARR